VSRAEPTMPNPPRKLAFITAATDHGTMIVNRMAGRGQVVAIEAQERIYYALAGNTAINNCFNACAINAAVSSQPGTMKMPVPNYFVAGSFSSLELKKRVQTEYIGQPIDYSESKMVDVPTVTIDSLNLARVELIKIDVEGMEIEALAGGEKCIESQHPMLLIEMLKSDKDAMRAWLEKRGYIAIATGMNFLGIHNADEALALMKTKKTAA
jgi:FkbM family methyltransferase